MLPIYICEDDAMILAAQKKFLEKQIMMEGYDMQIALCSRHPQEIVEAVAADPKRGIYFLDVELKDEPMDGFMLGQQIRKFDTRGFLIYVTSFPDLAFETFRYHLEALDYIVKGNSEKMLAGMRKNLAIITERMCKEQGEQKEYFTVKVLDIVRHVPVDEIMFFETSVRTHRIELHAKNDCIDFIGSMQELQEQFREHFLRVHRSYLVNVDKIQELDLKHRDSGGDLSPILVSLILSLGISLNLCMDGFLMVGTAIAEEKEKHTLRVLMTSSVTGMQYFIGSILFPFVLMNIINIVVLVISGISMSQVSVAAFLLVSAAASLISCVMGMIVGLCAKNQMNANLISYPLVIVLMMIPMFGNLSEKLHHISGFLFTGVLTEMASGFAEGMSYTLKPLDIAVLIGELIISILVFLVLYRRNGYEKD